MHMDIVMGIPDSEAVSEMAVQMDMDMKLTGMNTAKKRTISIEVGMQNAGLATNLATTTAQFASTPESAIICAVSCVWHSISGTLLAGFFARMDKRNPQDHSVLKHSVQH